MSAKLATLDLLKIKVFHNKGYDAILFVHDVINKILSCYSNDIVDVVMSPKFGNSSVSMGEVIITSVLYKCDQKNQYFWGVLLIEVQEFGTGTGYGLEILHEYGRSIKTESQKVLEVNSNVCKKAWQIKLKNLG